LTADQVDAVLELLGLSLLCFVGVVGLWVVGHLAFWGMTSLSDQVLLLVARIIRRLGFRQAAARLERMLWRVL
jgi:hypothetical protein